MIGRRATRATLVALAVTTAAPPVPAQPAGGTVDLSWDDCAPILAQKSTAVSGPTVFYASVTGHSEPHVSYQVWWIACDAQGTLPDAWRFDVGACMYDTPNVRTYDAQPPVPLAKSCPRFVPRTTQQFTIQSFQRYHLARFVHDFTWAVDGPGEPGQTCGGFERPVGIDLIRSRVTWVDSNLNETLFLLGNRTLLFRGAAEGCIAVPARASTWGSIKHQYR